MPEEKASLLIVDDERGPAESLRMIFNRLYNVFTANGGLQALEILRSTPIDVVTLDLRMPAMSGVEVMEHIKAFDPDVEVIVVTGYSSLDSAIQGLRHGVFDYISKPFDVPQISDLVQRAVARRRANLRARRMKEDFLSNLSHELRTPLSAIIGYSTILTEELERVLDPDQRTALARIEANSNELLQLVEGVLLLNAIDAGGVDVKIDRFDAAECVRRSVEKVEAAASDKGLALRVHVAADDLVAVTDEDKFERILASLLDNAVKFTPSGVVSVRIGHAEETGALQVEIADTGLGMEPAEVERVLEGLAQGDSSPRRRFRGLGIGLRIATRLTELLGGRLHVQSERGRGTQVTVTIPSHQRAANLSLH
jgi:two-component system, sensor histidine kinase and response regulator